MSGGCFDQPTDVRKGKTVFRAGFVEICEIYAYPLFPILFLYNDYVSQPIRVFDFLD